MLVITETTSSNSTTSRQNTNHAHRLDRADVDHFIGKLAESQGQQTGAHPAEVALLRFFASHCAADKPENDQFMANFMPMVREAVSFTQAINKTDPRGFHQAAFTQVDERKVRLALHQREMVRSTGPEAGKPEQGEWFFDQKWTLTQDAEPNFTIDLQTLIHGADKRGPIVMRTAEFRTTQTFPLSTAESLIGLPFGQVVDGAGLQGKYIGHHLDDWIIGAASNNNDSGSPTDTFTMKLIQP